MKMLKEIQCGPIRILRFVLLLVTGVYLGFTLSACSSGNGGGGGQTADLPPVVFLANKNDVDIVELFASLNGGEDIVTLSGAMAAGGNVVDFAISPDGLQVAYVADQRNDGTFELFVSPVDGSAPPANPVSGTMAGNGIATETDNPDRYSFAWSPDSERIAYRAAQDRAGVIELYTVRLDGTDNVKLHPDFTAGQEVETFAWAPDASRVAYMANQSSAAAPVKLYTSLPAGADNDRVSSDLEDEGNVDRFAWAPNSSRIAYRADQDTDEQFELFVTRPDNDLFVEKVSLPLTEDGNVSEYYAWAPDSSRLAYIAVSVLTPEVFRSDKPALFTVQPDGTSGLRVSGSVQTGTAFGVADFQWAPDSTQLSYVADQLVKDRFDLFVTFPNAIQIFTRVTNFAGLGAVSAADWSADSDRIAYIADQNAVGFSELFAAPRSGRVLPQPVSNLVDPRSDVESFAWSPDSSLTAFRADQDAVGEFELYTAPPDGSVNNKVSNVSATGGQVQQFMWEPGGAGIGYIADQDTLAQRELYLSLPDGSEVAKVSGELVKGGGVLRFDWVP
jgi:Tol biopolymer transport system component